MLVCDACIWAKMDIVWHFCWGLGLLMGSGHQPKHAVWRLPFHRACVLLTCG